jgi:hypothetical protein
MNPFDDCSARDKEFDANPPSMVGNIELVDCDDASASEAEVPDDPNRWTLPEIREASAVALFAICAAPVVAACLTTAAVRALASFESLTDE